MSDASAELEPDDNAGEEESTSVVPKGTEKVKRIIRKAHKAINEQKQKRTECNEEIAALRENLVTEGFSKKAQAAVEAYMNLNESDQENFDIAVQIMRSALGKPVQATLDLVHSKED